MAIYMPILKGREGEFKAIDHLPDLLAPHLMPIFEVVRTGRGPTRDACDFVKKVSDTAPRDLAVAVDVRHLADPVDGPRRPMRDIADDLYAWGIPMLPVLHLDDSQQRMNDVRYAAECHGGRWVLRLGGHGGLPDVAEVEESLDGLRYRTGLRIDRCHLVVDVFEVRSERDLTRKEPLVRKCVSWARRYPWLSVTVASGGMPESISHLPVHEATPLPRWDMRLWQRVRDLDVRYADYGIAHPGMAGKGWQPAPNLRYTIDDAWWIYRWYQDKGARPAMYDLCQALVAADHWAPDGAASSWGDAQIQARAAGIGGPGNATSWRAWGTSHHLTHVVRQLTRWDVPGSRRFS